MNDKNTWYAWIAVAFVLGLIIGFLVHWLMVRPVVVVGGNTDETVASTTVSMVQEDNSLSVNDQQAGSSVYVESVTLQKPGWVAIADDVNGKPGRILGAALFDTGTHSGIVSLLRNTIPGTSYFAVLYSDDSDYHTFSPKTDTVLTDTNGNSIMVQFTAGSKTASAVTGTTATNTPATSTMATTSATTSVNILNI